MEEKAEEDGVDEEGWRTRMGEDEGGRRRVGRRGVEAQEEKLVGGHGGAWSVMTSHLILVDFVL